MIYPRNGNHLTNGNGTGSPHNLRVELQPRMVGSLGGEGMIRWSVGITLAY
jgi:hypothetical protein